MNRKNRKEPTSNYYLENLQQYQCDHYAQTEADICQLQSDYLCSIKKQQTKVIYSQANFFEDFFFYPCNESLSVLLFRFFHSLNELKFISTGNFQIQIFSSLPFDGDINLPYPDHFFIKRINCGPKLRWEFHFKL